ncbi:MAG TPA: hypothetical protein PK446_00195, partial [Methanomassiliicoccaceae archaeon]|nr:hypothetical protein [Methanomassiliicoccaceae archaeon]
NGPDLIRWVDPGLSLRPHASRSSAMMNVEADAYKAFVRPRPDRFIIPVRASFAALHLHFALKSSGLAS